MALVLRETKGSPLTFEEMDGNLTYLQNIALLGATSASGGDALRALLAEDLGFVIPVGGFLHGTEILEGVDKFDQAEFFAALTAEDPETFKAPILREGEGNYIIHAGTRISNLTGSSQYMMLNGILFPQGGDIAGPGTFAMNMESDENTSQIYTYIQSLDFGFIGTKYFYNFDPDAEEHIHGFEIDAAIFGVFEVINVLVPDDATTWGEVTVTTGTLA